MPKESQKQKKKKNRMQRRKALERMPWSPGLPLAAPCKSSNVALGFVLSPLPSPSHWHQLSGPPPPRPSPRAHAGNLASGSGKGDRKCSESSAPLHARDRIEAPAARRKTITCPSIDPANAPKRNILCTGRHAFLSSSSRVSKTWVSCDCALRTACRWSGSNPCAKSGEDEKPKVFCTPAPSALQAQEGPSCPSYHAMFCRMAEKSDGGISKRRPPRAPRGF